MTKICTVLLLLACIASCFFPSTAYAEAECRYARVVKDGVPLYANEQCDRTMFTLEKSYYVEILETLDNLYAVSVTPNANGFPSVMGYVRKVEVTAVEVTPILPTYPSEQIYVTADSAPLRLLPLFSSEIVIVPTTTQRLNYYGAMSYYGTEWYYVYCAGKFGYVEAKSVSKPAIALHPTPLEPVTPVIKPQQPSENNEPQEPTNDTNKTPAAEILLIVFVALLAVGLTLALFLPGNLKKNDVFEQDI